MTTTLSERLGLLANGGRTSARLPERVRALIGEQEAASERLIGWVQLFVAAVLGGLYLIAPRPADAPMSALEPVPVAVAAYAVFTLARVALSYRGFLPGWLLVLSIVLDLGLLFGLIWAFHIQYGQYASFALKIPTFIYIFVFIALRALRFDHRYVLTAGLAAAAGWALLVGLAVADSPPGTVTRNFVTYITSDRILIGAEFDRVFTILLVTGILTLAVWRARRTLVTAVHEQTTSRELGRFLSSGLAQTIAAADASIEAGQAVERDAAILMLDVRGFTRFSTEVAPKDVVDALTRLHARVVPVIQANGGVIDKFLGDGIMATFGALKASETAAADALRALAGAMAEAGAWSEEQSLVGAGGRLEVNGAVAAGPVLFATLGNDQRLEYTVIGEAVNLAAKLEKHNKEQRSRALTTAETYARACAQGFVPDDTVQRRPECRVAGTPGTIDLVVMA